MKHIFLTFIFIITCYNVSLSQNKKLEDAWSGKYRMEPLGKQTKKKSPKQFYQIKKILNVNVEDVANRYSSDLERWAIIQKADTTQHEKKLRRFLFTEDRDEYKEFNWTALYKKGTMKCLDGGNIFICQTVPKTKITIGDESFISNSGIFAVLLHYGVFEFYKVTD